MTGTEHAAADPAALPPGPMTETEFRSLYERLRGQLPWGPDDRRGALNYITQAEILAALGEVTLGRTVSLAAPVEDRPAADNPDPARHQMKGPLGAGAGPGLAFSMDRIAMNIHGNAVLACVREDGAGRGECHQDDALRQPGRVDNRPFGFRGHLALPAAQPSGQSAGSNHPIPRSAHRAGRCHPPGSMRKHSGWLPQDIDGPGDHQSQDEERTQPDPDRTSPALTRRHQADARF
jgi:hypothetical protein